MEKLSETPLGWTVTKIGDVYDFIGGGTPDKKNPNYWGGDIPWASVKDIKNKTLKDTTDHITELGLQKSAAQLATPGDVLLVTRISPGKCIIAQSNIAINQDLKIVKPKVEIFPSFTFYLFASKERAIHKRCSGTTVLGIRLKELGDIPVPIPPKKEQQRIVAKIEELFSHIDKGVENLIGARDQLKIYRQALLKAAFEGRLTEQWRKENANKLETADALLSHIKTEREAYCKHQLENWKETVSKWEKGGGKGTRPTKPKKIKDVPPFDKHELAALPDLPNSWTWVRLASISANIQIGPFGSLLHKADYVKGAVPLVNPIHIKDQKIKPDWNLTVQAEKAKALTNYRLKTDDIVMGRRGEMGRCAVVTEKEDQWLCGTGSLFIRPLPIMQPNFYCLVLGSKRVKEFLGEKSLGTTMQNLNQQTLKFVPVPLCTIKEQTKITQEVDSKLTKIDNLDQTITQSLQQAETLRQSILKKAFSGQLVPQDPNDEPAAVLLERIRAERKTQKPKNAPQKPKTRKRKAAS